MMYKMVRDCDTVTLIALFARYAVWVSFPWNSIASFNVNGFPFLVNIYDSVSKIKDEQTNVRQSVFLRKHQIAADLETSTPTKLSYLERLMQQGPGGLSLRDQWLNVERLKRLRLSDSFFSLGKSQFRSGLGLRFPRIKSNARTFATCACNMESVLFLLALECSPELNFINRCLGTK